MTTTIKLMHSSPHLVLFFIFWPYHTAWGILVLQPATEPAPPALEAQSFNHWTTRDVFSYVDVLLYVEWEYYLSFLYVEWEYYHPPTRCSIISYNHHAVH